MVRELGNFLNRCIQILFSLLMLAIAAATIILDKNVESSFSNTVTYANGGYFLLAILVIAIIFFAHRSISGRRDISKKSYIALCVAVPLMVFFGWQLHVGRWIYWFSDAGDFGSIMGAAIGFNNGQSFEDWQYFSHSPNNANLAIALSWIYRLFNEWRLILLLGALLTNISAVLVALSVKNLTQNRFASICALVVSEFLMAMTWRAFLVYTDNFGMIIVALIIWVYTLDLNDKYKMPLIIILTAIGTFIKVTIIICFLAVLIHKVLMVKNQNKNFKIIFKQVMCYGVFSAGIFVLLFWGQKTLRAYHHLDLSGQYPKAWQYMFMVGQNGDVYGVTNSSDSAIRASIIEEAMANGQGNDYVKREFLKEALKRVENRGIKANIVFLLKKLNIAYNDGYFHNVQAKEQSISNELDRNILYELLEKENGRHYQISAATLQIAWDFVLFLLMISIFLLPHNDFFKFFEILILGITTYLMLFEGRSKYLYMFLPIYMVGGGISLSALDGFLLKIQERGNNKMDENGGKKKVGIVTFHFVNNFGGALQAYALQRFVADRCHAETIIIDYRNWFICFTDFIRMFPISSSIREISAGFETIGKRLCRKKKFKAFINQNMCLSDRYLNHYKLNRIPPMCDKYICGSDQIWNPVITMGGSVNYFLQFECNPMNKIAYAPSFGTDKISMRYKSKISKYIDSIGFLSVREKSGQKLIKEMTGREAEMLIDPTFLLEKKVWAELGVTIEQRKPYILLYIMQRDNNVYNYARKIKEELGIKLVEISRYGYEPDFVDETLTDVGPKEFLGLFRDAAYICTNSYHGLAYSIIFEKDFCLIPCKRFKARINSILELLHIEAVIDDRDVASLTVHYDKDYVRRILEKEREKAIKFLTESIGGNV